MPVECTSQPTTSTRRNCPDSTKLFAVASENRKPLHWARRSKHGVSASAEAVLQEERRAREVGLRREGRPGRCSRARRARGRAASSARRAAGSARSTGVWPSRMKRRSLDPRALPDPLVARVHELLEVVVRHDALGHVHAGAGDPRPQGHSSPPPRPRGRLRGAAASKRSVEHPPPRARAGPRARVLRAQTPPPPRGVPRARAPAPGGSRSILLKTSSSGVSLEPDLREHAPHRGDAALEVLRRGVHHVQEQVRLAQLLEGGAEGRDEVGREVADEAHRVGDDHLALPREAQPPRRRVEGREHAGPRPARGVPVSARSRVLFPAFV